MMKKLLQLGLISAISLAMSISVPVFAETVSDNDVTIMETGEEDLEEIEMETELEDPVAAFAARMYTVVLNRGYDESGLNYWVSELKNQKIDGAGIAYGFVCSDEFKLRNLSNDAFLDVLYKTFFNRAGDAAGKSYWISEMQSGKSREFVLSQFVNSKEFGLICADYGIARGTMEADGSSIYNPGVRAFIERLYSIVLGRESDVEGLEYWCHAINTYEQSPVEAAADFFLSDEYILQNKNTLLLMYQTFLEREPDEDGYRYWLDFQSGFREPTIGKRLVPYLLHEFAHSEEFRQIMGRYGLNIDNWQCKADKHHFLPFYIPVQYKSNLDRTDYVYKCINCGADGGTRTHDHVQKRATIYQEGHYETKVDYYEGSVHICNACKVEWEVVSKDKYDPKKVTYRLIKENEEYSTFDMHYYEPLKDENGNDILIQVDNCMNPTVPIDEKYWCKKYWEMGGHDNPAAANHWWHDWPSLAFNYYMFTGARDVWVPAGSKEYTAIFCWCGVRVAYDNGEFFSSLR